MVGRTTRPCRHRGVANAGLSRCLPLDPAGRSDDALASPPAPTHTGPWTPQPGWPRTAKGWPGSHPSQLSRSLNARRSAGAVRLSALELSQLGEALSDHRVRFVDEARDDFAGGLDGPDQTCILAEEQRGVVGVASGPCGSDRRREVWASLAHLPFAPGPFTDNGVTPGPREGS